MRQFSDFNIHISGVGPEVYTTCPQCSKTRKKPHVKCLSANTEKGVWVCHHCSWSGSLQFGDDRNSQPFAWKTKTYRRPEFIKTDAGESVLAFFAQRGISASTVHRYGIRSQHVYFPQLEESVPALVFPYYRGQEVINCKYRGIAEKVFRQEFEAEKILYGLNDIQSEGTVIVEGEIDVLSCVEAGYTACVSVPDGAPAVGSKPTEKKFEYLLNCEKELAPVKKIILALDGDGPGKLLEQELARRLGPERCWRVQWPDGCKDANDVLVRHGAGILGQCLASAKPWPIDQVVYPRDLVPTMLTLRDRAIPKGISTGWDTLDQFYTVMAGELTIVTGIPGHGKSEVLDQLMINIIQQHGWSVAFCSPENLPVERHFSKLIEKYVGAPFYDRGLHARMTDLELIDSAEHLDQHITFISPEESLTIAQLLHKAKALVFQRGIQGLILDPWNEFDHRREPGLSETEHVSASLGLMRRFARNHGVHVWVVAHPAKLQKAQDDKYPVPRPYDISGSAHWYNRADNCLSVWRDVSDETVRDVTQVHVQKVRNKYVGSVGVASLYWDAACGQLTESRRNYGQRTVSSLCSPQDRTAQNPRPGTPGPDRRPDQGTGTIPHPRGSRLYREAL